MDPWRQGDHWQRQWPVAAESPWRAMHDSAGWAPSWWATPWDHHRWSWATRSRWHGPAEVRGARADTPLADRVDDWYEMVERWWRRWRPGRHSPVGDIIGTWTQPTSTPARRRPPPRRLRGRPRRWRRTEQSQPDARILHLPAAVRRLGGRDPQGLVAGGGLLALRGGGRAPRLGRDRGAACPGPCRSNPAHQLPLRSDFASSHLGSDICPIPLRRVASACGRGEPRNPGRWGASARPRSSALVRARLVFAQWWAGLLAGAQLQRSKVRASKRSRRSLAVTS